jgi:hypothetical protein
MFHVMRNKRFSETGLLRQSLDMLRSRLPSRWTVEMREPDERSFRAPDAVLEIKDPERKTAWLVVETKSRLEPRDIPSIIWQLRQVTASRQDARLFLIAPFIGPRSRERLIDEGVGYSDATGNFRLALERPAIFVESLGANRDPWPDRRSLRSLRGSAAGRAVRAFCDFIPPYGIRQLGQPSKTSPATLSRVADVLEREAILTREGPRGGVATVDWEAVLRRWSQDYSLMRSNKVKTYLEPRGLKAFLQKLQECDFTYAMTGSIAAAKLAPVAEPRLAALYLRDADRAAAPLGLRPAETGGNVVVAEPFDPVVFDRVRIMDGIVCASPAQVAVDLLTSPGRSPSEAEALMVWMRENERLWRTSISTP